MGSRKGSSHESSPYSTGGGGVTFEHRVGAVYLAKLLTGEGGPELQGRRLCRIAFQAADDLVLYGAREGEHEASLELIVAVRRRAEFVSSDRRTQKLLGGFLEQQREQEPDSSSAELYFAICVAGQPDNALQVAELAALAKVQADADGFFDEVRGRHRKTLRKRLEHVVRLVQNNLGRGASEAEHATWMLLRRMEVLQLRLETPDKRDWESLSDTLDSWSRSSIGGGSLRDRLEVLAGDYGPSAARVDLSMLRRDAHEVLNLESRRREGAWKALRRFESDAREGIQVQIGRGSGALELARTAAAAEVEKRIDSGGSGIFWGESGVGKSALVLRTLAALSEAKPGQVQHVFLNLRQLPSTIRELRTDLGYEIKDLLGEVSAPHRLLVVDSAEYVAERGPDVLRHLLHAAKDSDLDVWVVSTADGRSAVSGELESAFGQVQQHEIRPLDDEDLRQVGYRFPQLMGLLDHVYSKQLIRRPVVADLLARAGAAERRPLCEADALEHVWEKLVRSDGRKIRGTPEAREQVFLELARRALESDDSPLAPGKVDLQALDGLRRDGLLRRVASRTSLEFSHDLLRVYALCKLLLESGSVVDRLLDVSAPRWTLPAARLATQVRLAAIPAMIETSTDVLAELESEFALLVQRGHGERWLDLPLEALLPLPSARDALAAGWGRLIEGSGEGLGRVLRILRQRHETELLYSPLPAEPVVELLLGNGWPKGRKLDRGIGHLIKDWLGALLLSKTPAGHELRLRVKREIEEAVADGDRRLERERREREEWLAARTPEEVQRDEERARRFAPLTRPLDGVLRKERRELPSELTSREPLERLALLGPDLGEAGEALLRRVSEEAPEHLVEALEADLGGHGIAAFRPSLLTELIESYYLDDETPGVDGWFGGWDRCGIRMHRPRSVGELHSPFRGPFWAMFQSDPRNGVRCLNRLLNHAVHIRELRGDGEGARISLRISGESRDYLGDEHVWRWYRGTATGPDPCISALRALELTCDRAIEFGVEPSDLVPILLDGCENLAMVGLVVGLLVRHLEEVGEVVDAFFTEPAVWKLEFHRIVHEHSVLAATTEGARRPARRKWSLLEAARASVAWANEERQRTLRELGQLLVGRASGSAQFGDGEELAAVRSWAGYLDAASYSVSADPEGVKLQVGEPEDVTTALEESRSRLEKGERSTGLLMQYALRYEGLSGPPERVTCDQINRDLATAQELVEDPLLDAPGGWLAGPVAVAASALKASLLEGEPLEPERVEWSAQLVAEAAIHLTGGQQNEHVFSIHGLGVDRALARALPLLLLPQAGVLRARLDEQGIPTQDLVRAAHWLATLAPYETRAELARTLDASWQAPCGDDEEECHHREALRLLEDSARRCAKGAWNPERQEQDRPRLEGRLVDALPTVEGDRIIPPELSSAIRGSVAAASSSCCCAEDAGALLECLVAAHRRGMLNCNHGYHMSHNDTLVVARAVLLEASLGKLKLLRAQIEGYVSNERLLTEFLKALSAAAEESVTLAQAAREHWGGVMDLALDLYDGEQDSYVPNAVGQDSLASLIPRRSYEGAYLRREYESDPIEWRDLERWRPQVERWLTIAGGRPGCVDALVEALSVQTLTFQVNVGLPWVEGLVVVDSQAIVSRSWRLPGWLRGLRAHVAVGSEPERCWQRVIDALVVAGEMGLRDLSD